MPDMVRADPEVRAQRAPGICRATRPAHAAPPGAYGARRFFNVTMSGCAAGTGRRDTLTSQT